MKFMTYNILVGGRSPDRCRRERLREVIRREAPDVLALQECWRFDGEEERSFLRRIAEDTGLTVELLESRRSRYHLALFHPAGWEVRERWVADDGFTHTAGLFSFQLPGGLELDLGLVHLDPSCEDRRRTEIATLLAAPRRTSPGRVTVVMGDFNALSARDEYGEALVETFEPQYRRARGAPGRTWRHDVTDVMESHGFRDALDTSPAAACAATFPTPGCPESLQYAPMRIDRIFHRGLADAERVSARVIDAMPAPDASDHYPVVAELPL